jgi:hypothetical protein
MNSCASIRRIELVLGGRLRQIYLTRTPTLD